MNNVEMKMVDGKLVITVDPAKTLGPSKSGKTTLIASTGGNVSVMTPAGTIKVGLNIFK